MNRFTVIDLLFRTSSALVRNRQERATLNTSTPIYRVMPKGRSRLPSLQTASPSRISAGLSDRSCLMIFTVTAERKNGKKKTADLTLILSLLSYYYFKQRHCVSQRLCPFRTGSDRAISRKSCNFYANYGIFVLLSANMRDIIIRNAHAKIKDFSVTARN